MSYAVYTTRGWILGSAPSGEASKTYSIYTEDFGLVHAKAQGVRLLQSKLRYSLDEYSWGTFSLVKGKEVWRITGAEKAPLPRKGELMRARVLSLVRRLVHGEERNAELVASLALLLAEEASEVEVLSRVLSALGYLDLSTVAGQGEREAIALINKALRETQL